MERADSEASPSDAVAPGTESDAPEPRKSKWPSRKGRFYHARILVLFVMFLVVAGWAARDIHQRRERTEWKRSLNVALVILRLGPVEPAGIVALRGRVPDLEKHLLQEYRRYREDDVIPFRLRAFGPVDVAEAPPTLEGPTILSVARYTYDRWKYLRPINEALGLDDSDPDSIVYIVARPPGREGVRFVEGASENGGRVGVVQVELAPGIEDFALFVTAHELFHTLGATDKYDAFGRTLIPHGLAEPDKVPVFPQRFAELMARNVVLAPGEERPPNSLGELRVGIETAQEIKWR